MEEIAVIKVKFQESGGKNKEWKQEVNKEKEDKQQKEGKAQEQTKYLWMQLIIPSCAQIFVYSDGQIIMALFVISTARMYVQ